MNLTDRKAAIMRHRLCFGCLSKGHHNSTCRIKHTCNICGLRHPTLLHDYSNVSLSSSSSISESRACSTMVVPVRVCNGDRSRIIYALLDSQSNSHFVSKKVVSDLGIPSESTTLELTTMTGKEKVSSRVVERLSITSLEGKRIILVILNLLSHVVVAASPPCRIYEDDPIWTRCSCRCWTTSRWDF